MDNERARGGGGGEEEGEGGELGILGEKNHMVSVRVLKKAQE